ncbi:thiolase C-terminal domain-containing protein [Sphaerochaeta globosa]|uniref:Propanoyl-CoA C-acyltransferase n=1 Tax=Sphaerochaeta globosa (strain ATCC BAA-1886 / DSM 22777 / Buddy) TaxID=158189 RepID=F0RTC9_SPHGB|nr:acetyl-CoA acetyltransferase [Sphaerochaeta globosa]ADY14414.1 Propanoyl-CoA C-acyltransferase [Sphaerochaeta globosa str. Buddy]
MANVGIVGIGHTRFGNSSEYDLSDVLAYAATDALEDAHFLSRRKEVDQVIVGNMASGLFCHQSAVASALVSRMDMEPVPAELVENGPASGASAIKIGYMAIASGMADIVLVVGGEIMRKVSGWVGTEYVATMLQTEAEYNMGLTLPAFGGMFTRMYMERYGLTERDLALLAVKNHANGAKNKYAHIQAPCSIEAISDGPEASVVNTYVAEPLRMYSTCPVSDGAAALLLVNMDSPKAKLFPKKPIRIAGIASATDTHCVHNRKDPLLLDAVRIAAEKAYAMAKLTPKDISFAELHDAFSILELAISEEVGFFERGKSFLAVREGQTNIDGRLPINTSGGLKSKGHPVGATGVSQAVELVRQLRGEAEKGRQVSNPRYGMSVNFGGFGNNVVALICAKE